MAREFIVPGRIITGAGALKDALPFLCRMGKKALIVTGPHVGKLGGVRELRAGLENAGTASAVFSQITGEPTDQMIYAGLKVYQEEGCDFLIGFGGGSPLDSMKAIAVLSVTGGSISDFMGKVIDAKLPPMAAIPTTAGTGSETTQFTIITDTEKDIKMLLKGPCLMPDLAIVDPAFTLSAPKGITAATGLDALTHATEAYTSRKAQPMSDTFALSAVKRIFQYLPRAYADGSDVKAREEMSLAAFEAGVAFNNASVTLIHGMSRPIGALFHVPHGISNAMLLPTCFAFALDGAQSRFADMARAIGKASEEDSDGAAAEAFLEAIREICGVCEIPTLEAYGIDREKFFASVEKMAADAIASGSPANTAKAVTEADVRKLYAQLWEA
ncbi:MAG: iron-containing alcohol dehydrogenase [Candidatus Limivivens sp.]|nr:iron-containing alcohol dehydrogenase [Candidatus Limivivens sp.]